MSAPGKRDKSDTKITDILINCFNLSKLGEDFTPLYEKLKTRFLDIVKDLSVEINLIFDFCSLKKEIESHKNYDLVVSRGEFILAKIVAKYLNYNFLDAKNFLTFNDEREVDLSKSKKKFNAIIKQDENYVIPGFYCENLKGEIVTFSRGGSDVTGAIVAYLTKSDVYENFTDVDGFFSANPQIVSAPKLKKMLTYDELRALSFFGANVLHPSCVQFLKENSIVLNLKNTFNPACDGSFILKEIGKHSKELAGISGQKNFLILTIKKFDIQNGIKEICKIEKILKNSSVADYFVNISLDQISVIIKNDFANNFSILKIVNELKTKIKNDSVEVRDNVAIISVVGEAIKNYKAVQRKVMEKIYDNNIDLIFVTKNESQSFIQFAIDEKYFENVIKILHNSLF